MIQRIFFACCLLLLGLVGNAQTEQVTAKHLRATQKWTLDTVTFTRILKTITSAATHSQGVTAKAVYDYVQSVTGSVSTTARLSGSGTSGSPLDIAQQGATTGQALRWSGTAWVPNGLNLYDVVTTSGTVAVKNNQVIVNTLSAGISLNLPACNATNDGVSFLFFKSGSDTYGVDIEPAGSETFNDSSTTKTLFSRGTGLQCTCRWTGSAGSWFYINM